MNVCFTDSIANGGMGGGGLRASLRQRRDALTTRKAVHSAGSNLLDSLSFVFQRGKYTMAAMSTKTCSPAFGLAGVGELRAT